MARRDKHVRYGTEDGGLRRTRGEFAGYGITIGSEKYLLIWRALKEVKSMVQSRVDGYG